MDKQTHYLEQYKMHREEVMLHIQQMFRAELSAVLAVGAVYAWLIHESETLHIHWCLWCVPPFIILLSAVRCTHLVLEMKRIGRYLSHIEDVAFGKDGWEHFKIADKRHLFDKIAMFISGSAWAVAFLGSVVLSWYLYHNEPAA